MKITHNNSFWSFPERFITPFKSAPNGKVKVMVRFNEESKYTPSSAENDWLKATGVSFSPKWDARQNSIMLAYRYLPEKGYWQICPYYHDATGKAHQPDFDESLDIVIVNIGETGIAEIDCTGEVPAITLSVFNYSLGKLVVEPVTYYCYGVTPTNQNRLIASYAGGSPKIKGKFSYAREIEV